MKCHQCGNVIKQIWLGRKFCSRSCAASHNNLRRQQTKQTKKKISQSLQIYHDERKRREGQTECLDCGKLTAEIDRCTACDKKRRRCIKCNSLLGHKSRCKYCGSCREKQRKKRNWLTVDEASVLTIGEIKERWKNCSVKNASTVGATIRFYSKKLLRHLIGHPCQYCGYDTHTEICHIKPISQFDDNAMMGEIAHPTNIVVLCRNHHWELDNGILTMEEILSRKLPA